MEKDSLLLQEVDELDIAVLAKVALELFLGVDLKVLDVANVDITRRAAVHGERDRGRERAAVLAPADLQPTVVQGKALVRSDLEESERRGWVDEGHELRYGQFV